MNASEGALVQEALLEHAGQGGAGAEAPHRVLLHELVKREEEEEAVLEEEEGRLESEAGQAVEALPGWVCSLLAILTSAL